MSKIKIDSLGHWLGSSSLPDEYAARPLPFELDGSEVIRMAEKFDVMLTTLKNGNTVLMLDEKGRGFRQR